MRKSIFAAVLLCTAFAFQSNAQFTFSASPGLNLNTASFGYRAGNFVPYFGFQFLTTNVDYEESGSMFGNYSTSARLNVFMPTLGLKYFAFEAGDVNAYFNAALTKPFISGSFEEDGVSIPEAEDALDDISIWGGQVGFGAEYFFSENFSLGGEFGLRFIGGNIESEYTEYDFDPTTGQEIENEVETSTQIGFNPTYSKISLNFYF